MGKKTLVSVCLTVVLVAALSTAALAAVDVQAPDTVTSGSEIQIKVTGTTMGLAANVATTGLEFVSVNGGLSDESSIILLKDVGGMEGVYTYRVTAAEGEQVSFALTRVTESDGEQDIPEDNITWAGTVGGAFTTVTTQPTATVPPVTVEPTVTVSDAAAGGAATNVETQITAAPSPTDGPVTADASLNIWMLGIAAAACAVAAVLIGRKMFRRAR